MVSVAWLAGVIPARAAEKVVLRIRAGNPAERVQSVSIKSNLPSGIGTNEIINLAGLDLGYDVRSGTYYVHKNIQLGPKEIAEFNVEISDIWTIPPASMEALRKRASDLAGKLEKTGSYDNAQALGREVAKAVEAIKKRQAEAEVKAGARITDHIRAYDLNVEVLRSAKRDLGHIENLVLAAGKDPDGLQGEVETPPRVQRNWTPDAGASALTIQIRVHNTSSNETRRIAIRRDLPSEIRLNDVLDAGGLEVGSDPKTGLIYVFKEQEEVEPLSTKVFEVKVRDRWNVNASRVRALTEQSTNLLAKVASSDRFASVAKLLEDTVKNLEEVGKQKGPDAISDRYVAFHREQSAQLDEIETKLERIESVLKPTRKVKYGFDVQPPSVKTTWRIIYVILLFLGTMSLLFFLRWYGRSKAEKP